MMITLRPAIPSDLKLLQYWDRQPHVTASIPNEYWKWETELYRSPDWQHSGVFWGVFISETSVGLFTFWLFTKGRWKTKVV